MCKTLSQASDTVQATARASPHLIKAHIYLLDTTIKMFIAEQIELQTEITLKIRTKIHHFVR